tara:strand:- start:124 stop:366 length:243 start_codon:yes stop_codon:yes gene_type:complete
MSFEENAKKELEEIKNNLEVNTKRVQLIDEEIKDIKEKAEAKLKELNEEKNKLIQPILEDQGALNKLEKLLNIKTEVKSN